MTLKALKKQIGNPLLTNRELNLIRLEIECGKEKWKPVDKNGWYQISNLGRIKSIARTIEDDRHRIERFLHPQINRYGYLTIYINPLKKNYLIHRLKGIAFKRNPKNKKYINHKDGVKCNNDNDNIEWSTAKENSSHAIRTGLKPKTLKGKDSPLYGVYNNHLSKPILQIDLLTNEIIKEWVSSREVKRVNGWDNRPISLCALGKGRRKTAHGYKWKYKTQNNASNITANIQ